MTIKDLMDALKMYSDDTEVIVLQDENTRHIDGIVDLGFPTNESKIAILVSVR